MRVVAIAGIHKMGIAIVLIGHVECRVIATNRGHERDVSIGAIRPYTISAGKDGYCSYPWRRANDQTRTVGIDRPISGIAPVQRQIIAQQMPLLPRPPHAVSTHGVRARALGERVAIRRIEGLTTNVTGRLYCMTLCGGYGVRRKKWREFNTC